MYVFGYKKQMNTALGLLQDNNVCKVFGELLNHQVNDQMRCSTDIALKANLVRPFQYSLCSFMLSNEITL